ncbi:MAG: hypothetical protein GY842_27860, partial [bacterium]|nr:hypothetical protein [bacterium]
MNALTVNTGLRRRRCFGGTLRLLVAVVGLLAGSALFCYGMFAEPDGIVTRAAAPRAAESASARVPIQQVRLGQRVPGRNPELSDADRAAIEPVDPAMWRTVSLKLTKPDGSDLETHLLRPRRWLDTEGVTVGRQVYLDLPEMGTVGWAAVTAVAPCPTLADGDGSVVTGRFIHTRADVLDLQLAGEPAPIGATATHPFWSLDRQAFVPAGDLTVGERIATLRGETHVVSMTSHGAPETVYNLEVWGEHVYHVGRLAALVH